MLFSSTVFLCLFLPTALVGYYIVLRKTSLRNYFLLLASLFFYAWGEPIHVLLMLLSIGANFGFGLLADAEKPRPARKLWMILAVVFDLGILFGFKYLNFAADNLNLLLGTGFELPVIALPIGISFFTFQALSYVIDVYRGTARVQRNPLYLGLYISFFPQLIAGPIVRYNTIAQQIEHRTVTPDSFQEGVIRFVQGLSKKIILANVLSVPAEQIFSAAAKSGAGGLSVAAAWLGSLAYTFQIYYDFSGYSDMAIGLGKMFGFTFEENFRYPYLSASVSEFWNRWHISLGHWFRDYVYFPLGGSRVSRAKLVRNLFVVWMLTGIWHGAAWQFILWGLAYGVLISLEKLTGFPKKLTSRPAMAVRRTLTFLIVNAGWVLFGCQNITAAGAQLAAMAGIGANAFWDGSAAFLISEYWPFFLAAAFLAVPAGERLAARLPRGAAYEIGRAVLYLLLMAICLSYLAMGAHNPFIYFNF